MGTTPWWASRSCRALSVWCSSIRAGAGLAGLVADGDTEVHDVFHIDRGYPLFVENLVSLGAEIDGYVVSDGHLWISMDDRTWP